MKCAENRLAVFWQMNIRQRRERREGRWRAIERELVDQREFLLGLVGDDRRKRRRPSKQRISGTGGRQDTHCCTLVYYHPSRLSRGAAKDGETGRWGDGMRRCRGCRFGAAKRQSVLQRDHCLRRAVAHGWSSKARRRWMWRKRRR